MRTYRNQFPADYAPPVEVLSAGLFDTSWGNDACPSFCHMSQKDSDGSNLVTLWVDHADESQRECAGKRYVVTVNDEAGEILNHLTLETDSVYEALSYLRAEVAKLSMIEVNQVLNDDKLADYGDQVAAGTMTEDEAKKLCMVWHWSVPALGLGGYCGTRSDAISDAKLCIGMQCPKIESL